jgi:serine/threonine protein phosphatase PrpC
VIHCFNPNCQTANADHNATCQKCHWPLVRRFLWAIGPDAAQLPVGTLVVERYQVVQPQLLLDTHPSRSPLPLDTVPPEAAPYLELSTFTRAVPRPFTQVSTPEGQFLLLEEVPVQVSPQSADPQLMARLTDAWAEASPLHQLSWLWQLAQLWQPLAQVQAAATLLRADLVRVDGADVRLLALEVNEGQPDLAALGLQWRGWAKTAQSTVKAYCEALADALSQGHLSSPALEQSLTAALEQITAPVARQVQLAAYSDQGPTRQRNEDACYPVSGTQQTWQSAAQQLSPKNAAPLVVVCDGIGGHQGGDVASKLAIEVVTQRLNPLLEKPNQPHATLVTALEQAILAANQEISAQNDQAQRQARDRMGTTIVIGLVYGARLYIAHLGDSRAYQVRPSGCRQITLDDDVAAREMRLGYSFYRDALLNPGSGSLVQALGMADSQYLHPMVQMQVVAEDGLWLICSDGLSDNDLVTRLWSSELLPVLTKGQSVGAMGQKLIQLANTYNGHDNVTVGLVRVSAKGRGDASLSPVDPALATVAAGAAATEVAPPSTTLPPASSEQSRSPRPVLILLAAFGAAAIAGGGIAFWGRDTLLSGSTPTPESAEETGGTTLSPSAAPPAAPSTVNELTVGQVLQIQQLPSGVEPESGTLTLVPEIPDPPLPDAIAQPVQLLPVGTIVQVVTRQKTPDNQLWVRLKVCSLPTGVSPTPAENGTGADLPRPGDISPPRLGAEGWILEAVVRPTVQPLPSGQSNPDLCPE